MNETFPKRIENPRDVMISDFITVIRDNGCKCKTDRFIGADMPLSKIRVRKGGDTVTVIAETPQHGEIYKYGNHGNYWEQIGTTCGYA